MPGLRCNDQVIRRRYRPVRKHIIDEAGAVRSWETDIDDLDRCWSKGHDLQPIAANLAAEVDQDIYVIFVNLLSRLLI